LSVVRFKNSSFALVWLSNFELPTLLLKNELKFFSRFLRTWPSNYGRLYFSICYRIR